MVNKKVMALYSVDPFSPTDRETKALRKKIQKHVVVDHIKDIKSIRVPTKP